MCIEKKSTIIGLTGSFGSGCSTLADALEDLGYEKFSLSNIVKDEWKKRNSNNDIFLAHRSELQNIGDEFRKKNGNDFLAKEIIKQADNGNNLKGKYVFDSIRNLAEIKYFRDNYPNFYLIAVDCPRSIRWERSKKNYYKNELKERDFEKNDERDKDEEEPYGQQVQLCVYEADVVINNDDNCPNTKVAIKRLKDKVNKLFLRHISENGESKPISENGELKPISENGELKPIPENGELNIPNDDEACMTIAYTASLMSKCIKRQVGAVIVDRNNVIVSIGYNQNPNHKSCKEDFGRCYRDIYKDNLLELECRECQKHPKDLFKCSNCGTNLFKQVIPDKALSRCLSLHAEEIALMNAGTKNFEGHTLYTTTYPCLICARKIAYSGIKKIVYVEAYTDPDSEKYIKESDIVTTKFEGIKARAYFRLFSYSRRKIEEDIKTEDELNNKSSK